jgi:hypothetical protein
MLERLETAFIALGIFCLVATIIAVISHLRDDRRARRDEARELRILRWWDQKPDDMSDEQWTAIQSHRDQLRQRPK